GYTTPNTSVTILKDGRSVLTTQSKSDGTFQGIVTGLERGTYSFQVFDTDSLGRTSAPYSAMLSVSQGTINSISNIIIPPTIGLSSDTISLGDDAEVIGNSIPTGEVEITMLRQSDATTLAVPMTYTASTSPLGAFALTIPG